MIIRNSMIFQTTILLCWLLSVQSFDLKDAITARLRFHKGDIYSEDEQAAESSSHHSSSNLKTKGSGSWTLPKIGVGFRLYVLGGKKHKDGHHKKPMGKKFPKKMIESYSPPSSSHFSHHHHHQMYSPEEEAPNSYGALNQRFPMMNHQHSGGNNAPLFPYRHEQQQHQQQPVGFGGSDQSFDFPVKGNYQPELHSGQGEQHQSFRFPEDIHTKFIAHSHSSGNGNSGGSSSSSSSQLNNPGLYANVVDMLKHNHGFREEMMPGYQEMNHGQNNVDQGTTADHSPINGHTGINDHSSHSHHGINANSAINGHNGINYVASGSHGLLMSAEQPGMMTAGGSQFLTNSIPQFKPFPAGYLQQVQPLQPQSQRYPASQVQYYTVDEDSLGRDEGIIGHLHSSPGQDSMVEQESSASGIASHSPSQRFHSQPQLGRLSGDDKLLKTLKLVLDIARATKQGNNNNTSNKKTMLIRNPNSLRNFKRSADKRSSSVSETDQLQEPQVMKTSESKDTTIDSLEGDLNKLIVALEDKKKGRGSEISSS